MIDGCVHSMALLEQNDVVNSPYEVWTLFRAKFSAAFASSAEKQTCIAILNEIFETYPVHCKRLVPPLINSTNQNINDDYIRCNVWLFGQFVAVFLRDYLENQKNKCLEAQIALLQYIGEKNPLIYHSLVRSYVRVLEDLCNTLCSAEDQFQSTVFEWFRCDDSGSVPSTINIQWENTSYEIRSVNQLIEMTNLTLKIFVSQISHVCRMCSAVLMSLWRSCVSLLRHLDSDKSLVYHLVSRLIKENQLPDHEEKFDSITGELLLHITSDVGRICQMGKIKGEEEFCGLLKVLGERLRSDICYDSVYLNSLYCLISQCSVPLAECTQDAILAFFNVLLSLSSDCEAEIFALCYENSAHTINLSLVASILQQSIEKLVSQLCERDDDRLVDVFRCSKKWKLLIEQTGKHVREMEIKLNVASSKQVAGVLKLARYITKSAVKACFAFPGIHLIFFGDEIHSIISSLVKIAQVFPSKKTLKLFFDILTNVLTLPEAEDYDPDKRRFLIALLSFPLPSFQHHLSLSTYVPCNFREKYARLTAATDDEMKQSSITNLMRVRTLESQFKSELCREIVLNSSAPVFQSLPIFICNLKKDDDERWEWLRDYLGEANEAVLSELSPFIREIVCALDGNCAPLLTKARFHCRLCDNGKMNHHAYNNNKDGNDDLDENGKNESIVTEWMPSDRRRTIIHKLIFSVMAASESARYNVLSTAIKLSNHVCESEYETFLSLLHDCFASSDHRVRKKIVQITPNLLFREILPRSPLSLDYRATKPRHSQFDRYAKSLQDTLVTSLVHEDADTQYCCINTVCRIGCIPIEMTLFPCVNLLLNAMLWASCFYAPLAKFNIERVAKAHDLVEEHIYLKYRERIFPLVTHVIVINFTFYETDLRSLRFDYATIFNTLTQCHILKHLLPHTIQYPRIRVVVDELAELTDMSVAQMLRNGFRHVLLHAMLNESDQTVAEILRLMERETGQKTCDLLSGCVAKVLADLLINYEETPVKVRRCILAVRQLLSGQSLDEMWPTAESQTDEATIVAFVQHRFFGVMMSLENQLCSDLIPRKARRQIISSLESIIRLMGSAYITSVRFKVLLTLRAIVSTEKATESPSHCVQLWDTFVRSIDPKALGPILSTIFVSLLPFMGHHRRIIERLFRYLTVENGDAIGDHHLRELYFVELHQCDLETFTRIDGARRTYDDTASLEERLEWLAELCQHEIVEIKLHALKRLNCVLSTNHKRISLLMLASDSIDGSVCRVLRVLVDGFRNVDEKIHKSSGVCLGEFGAIDPSCIPNTMIKVDDAKKYTCYGIDDVEFVLNALTVLCRGYQMAKNNSIMDTFALAIQTTLKAYNVTEVETCLVWSKIPKNLREIIQPFHTTTYVLLSAENELSGNVPHLIYSTRGCTTVQKWAHSWSHFLISLLPVNSKEKNILQYFKGVISYDNECMLLFLPHILLNAIFCSHEGSHAKIYEEMMSVIRDDKTGGGRTESQQQQPPPPQSATQLVVTEQLSMIRNTADMSMDLICVKTVFRLLDVLYKKYRDIRCALNGRQSAEFKKLTAFLSKFCKYQLAKKSFERKEYARSLLYMEEYLTAAHANANAADRVEDSGGVDKYLAFLAKTYVYLNDVDNVKGLFAEHSVKLRHPQHVIMLHEITEQFQDAAICYQQLLRDSDEERCMLYEKRMISCYLSMNQPEMALRFANSFSLGKLKNAKPLDDVKCEALCSLAQYDQLASLTATKSAQMDENWGVRVGRAVVHFLEGNEDGLREEIDRIRRSLAKSLHMSSAACGGYKECYESIVKLHILNEFEKVAALVFRTLSEEENGRGVEQWQAEFRSVVKLEFEERLHKLQPVSRVLQPVLNTRQALFSVASELLSKNKPELVSLFDEEIRKCWLKVIEIANRRRNFQLAYSNIVAIDNYQLKGFFIEKAKYYWEKMEQQEALRTLQHGLHFHYKNLNQLADDRTPENLEDRKICSEALILIGTYNDAMVNTDLQTNLAYFQNAVDVYPQCEKTLLKLAQYQDKMFAAAAATLPKDRYRTNAHLYTRTVQVYGQSLHYGCEFVYQSLSRMLNIWMDFGAAFVADKKSGGTVVDLNNRKIALQDMSKHIESFAQRLPAYYFCTAFSLVMSRISHPLIDCFGQLALIIVRCLQNYPNQILWQFVSLYKAKNRDLHQRYNKIINDPRLAALIPLVKKYQELFEQFSQLAKSSRSPHIKSGNASLTSVFKNARLLIDGAGFDDVLIPAQKFLTIVLPRRSIEDVTPTATATADQKNKAHNPFPEKMVYISRIRDQIYVYSSLQKPIRVSLVGTDGLDYPMIFKAMDDMRIDCRCMEFNSVVNTYLKRDPEARERALHVRIYTVLPLLDKCGVIEFIPNLHTMRAVNQKMRKSFGLTTVPVKQHQCELEDSLAKKKESFAKLVALFPPLLHEWYKLEFPNPTSWYAARTAYTRTLAVMSMVGYIVGLGDRHNDNILLDSTNGDVIHVDFNVLFNKGELLAWPERVPFRLTHSMKTAMGPLGYEGAFVCTCEIVNRILRNRKEQLLSVLNTFLYDPLDFPLAQPQSSSSLPSVENLVSKVESRLNGSVTAYKKATSRPLSVEGQTRKLIEEATDEDNLCQMFIGWSAYI